MSDILEVRAAKKKLEIDIARMMSEFESKHRVGFTNIGITSVINDDNLLYRTASINLVITI